MARRRRSPRQPPRAQSAPPVEALRRVTFGFPQLSAAVHRGSANPRVSGVGLIWNSLDSLVRNEPFQWVTATLGPFVTRRAAMTNLLIPGQARRGPAISTRFRVFSRRCGAFSIRSTRVRLTAGAEGRPQANASPTEKGGPHRQLGQSTSRGPIGHWDHTNAAFPFLQGIVNSVRLLCKVALTGAPPAPGIAAL